MDFIEQLPEFQGFTDISVVVDCLTKQAIFISTKRSINTAKLAKVLLKIYAVMPRSLQAIIGSI